MPDDKGQHIRSIVMKNLFVWIVLISTAAVGVAVAQPTVEEFALQGVTPDQRAGVFLQATQIA